MADSRPALLRAAPSGWHAVSRSQLAARVATAADRLGALGVGAGDVVAVGPPDPYDQVVWTLAADARNAVPAVLDPRWPAARRSAALASTGATAVVDAAGPGRLPITPVGRAGCDPPRREPEWIVFTSGSTGTPGALRRTHRSWTDSFPAVTGLLGLEAGDRVLIPGPLSTSLCAFATRHALAVGAVPVLLPQWPPTSELPPLAAAHLVPTMLADLVSGPVAARLPAGHRPRVALVGAATLDPALATRAARAWPRTRVVEYYGSSEQSFVSVRRDPPAGSVGVAFPGVRLQIRDDAGRPLPHGRPGSVWTSSPWAAAYRAGSDGWRPLAGPDGWVGVGDRGMLSADGVLTLLGRGRIVTGGHTVDPAAVESVLRAAPGVRDAVVLGLPHRRLGEVVAAVVEGSTTRSAVRAACAAHLAAAQRPRRWYTGTLPRTGPGKPDRAAVAAAVTGNGFDLLR